jgi:hypothetical protein
VRTFLVLMVLVNLAYFGWTQGWIVERPAAVTAADPGFQAAPQTLVRLDEVPRTQLALMDLLSEAQVSRSAALDQLQQLQSSIEEVASDIDENQQNLQQSRAETQQVQGQLIEALDAAISELSVEEGAAVLPWCATAGVFPDLGAANGYRSDLARLGVTAVIETRQEPASSTWWVYMPAFNSEAAASAMLGELQAGGVDSYYMRTGEGDMAGGISLGVYSRRDSALIAQQQLADRGYPTSIREVERLGERHYVVLRMSDAAQREGLEWAGFIAANPGLEVTENACEMIAPENQVP